MKAKSKEKSEAPFPAIWTVKVECLFGAYLKERCIRVIELPEDTTLFGLHMAIQEAVHFDNDHLYEFYAGRSERSRRLTFGGSGETPFDVSEGAELALNQIYPLPERFKLFYLFDFGDSWTFQITKLRQVKAPEPGAQYPRVVDQVGPDPKQYPSWDE